MKYLAIFPFILLFFILSPTSVVAKLLINEFSSFTSDDWVELYNDGVEPVTLSEFTLRDSSATNRLDLDGTLFPYTVIAVDFSNYLNKPGDTIKIVAKSDENKIEDEITYGTAAIPVPGENQSTGRKTNGSGEWSLFASFTKGSSNETAIAIQPLPTVTTTPTTAPTLTKTPTPTKVPTATKIPTATKAPTPTKTPTPIKTPPSTKSQALAVTSSMPQTTLSGEKNKSITGVLSASDDARPTSILAVEKEDEEKEEKEVIVGGASSDNVSQRLVAMLPIFGGMASLIFCAILLYLHYRKTHNG